MPLETQDLSGGYREIAVIRDINLGLQTGEWLSLVGANGSGKSTLLKLASRILKPFHGAVLLDGEAIHQQPAQVVAQQLALLPQQPALPAGLTVKQLVSLGRTPHQAWWQWGLSTEDEQQVQRAIAATQIEQFQQRPVEQLSGGERQRAFLALALAQNPKVLLLDEPTTFLDIRYQLQLLELLKRLNQQQGLSVITVLHDINLAARYSDRIAMLSQGEIVALGSPPDVLTPENLARVFHIQGVAIETPVGLQICPLAAVEESIRS